MSPMSLESALDEERREILKLLEAPPQGRPSSRGASGLASSLLPAQHGSRRTQSPPGPRSPVRSMLDVDSSIPPPAPAPAPPSAPVRSMLDVDSEPPPTASRASSIAGTGVGVTPSTVAPAAPAPSSSRGLVRSMLGPSISPSRSSHGNSVNTSPVDSPAEGVRVHRTASDAAAHPPLMRGPKLLQRERNRRSRFLASLESDSSFAPTPDRDDFPPPRRAAQRAALPSKMSKSMARVMQAMDLGDAGPRRGIDRGRLAAGDRGGLVGRASSSRSPSGSLVRGQSPHAAKLNINSFNLLASRGKLMSDSGELLDMNSAYRRLSDANLARSGGSLSHLPKASGTEGASTEAGDALPSDRGRGTRLHKDYPPRGRSVDDGIDQEADGEDQEVAVVDDTSDEDSDYQSPGDWDADHLRGRKHRRGERPADANAADMMLDGAAAALDWRASTGSLENRRQPRSQLAAAEEERRFRGMTCCPIRNTAYTHTHTYIHSPPPPQGFQRLTEMAPLQCGLTSGATYAGQQVSSRYQVRSLLAPPVTVTGPAGERLTPRKPGVHPSTSFDQGTSTPVTSDTDAEISDIRRAQRLGVSISPIVSTPEAHRAVRTIVRGDFAQLQQEAEDGSRRVRKYLVATDLSDEAAYALEWSIGTILRDGDTLIALYAMDDESKGGGGITATAGAETNGSGARGVGIGEGSLGMDDDVSHLAPLVSRVPISAGTPTSFHAAAGSGLSPLSAMTSIRDGAGGVADAATPGTAATTTTARTTATTAKESGSPDGRNMSRAEQERWRATVDISNTCVKLLRRTRLQVRIVVEAIHCKSPKHLITEVVSHGLFISIEGLCSSGPWLINVRVATCRLTLSARRSSSSALEVEVRSRGRYTGSLWSLFVSEMVQRE